MKNNFIIIGFDADDTLWVNEPYYREIEKQFCDILTDYGTEKYISDELYKIEVNNLDLYGFGAKAFTLSLIETALKVSDNGISQSIVSEIIKLGKSLINKPVVLLDGVQDVLEKFHKKGKKLIIATKGDLLDQERKLKKSNLDQYFHHIEIMSDKKESDYLKLLSHLDIEPEDFLMIGNSLKSDIKPVLNIGGYGIHIPYHTTWQHEEIPKLDENDNFLEIEHINEIIKFFDQ
jgi:putative hydrolase of the HAD superfamily